MKKLCRLALVLLAGGLAGGGLAQENLTSCASFVGNAPRLHASFWCYQEVAGDAALDDLMFTALAYGDSVVYAARPMAGQVVALADLGAGRLGPEQVLAHGLTRPTTLVYAESQLFVHGERVLYAISPQGEVTTLVDDLPGGSVFWPGGIAVDEMAIYLGIGAPCGDCAEHDPRLGVVIRVDRQDGAWQVVARGLRDPAALLIHNGRLWISDSAPDRATGGLLDELNSVALAELNAGAILDFGYPACAGHTPLLPEANCATTLAPVYVFEAHSHIIALYVYPAGTARPEIGEHVLVAQAGGLQRGAISGYAVMALDLATSQLAPLMPVDPAIARNMRLNYVDGFVNTPGNYLNQIHAGFYPRRVQGLTASPGGVIFISWGGRILSLTPRSLS